MLENNISVKPNNHISDNAVTKLKPKTEIPFDVTDPAKVTRTPEKESESQVKQELFNYNPDSVFDKFVKSLQNSPVLSASAKKLLLSKQFINGNIKKDPILSVFFESFLKNIEMNDSEILEFLKFQKGTYTKFQGEFFNELRNLLIADDRKDFKVILNNFLRSYDCFVSVEETNKSIGAAIKNIERNLPDILKATFNEMTEKLILDAKYTDLNLGILKNEVIPFLGKYISRMNDFGILRDYVSVLVHNLIRLEFSSKDIFSDELENLFAYLKYNFDIDDKQMDILKKSFIDTYETTSSAKNDSVKAFLTLLKDGAAKSESPVNKSLMKEMADSILFSHNVNIPLIHMFLPLNYNGMFMFSEIWIGREEHKKARPGYEQTYKVFITFDIQNLGYFESILKLSKNKLVLDIYVPCGISSYTEKIRKDLDALLCKNGIITEGVNVRECVKVRRFNEVFSNLTERKNSVDVTI